MPRKLVDVDIEKVSGVDAAANNRKWLIIKQKRMKTEDGVQYPAEAFAYVPDLEKPSTWKLRLWESPERKETARQVGMALAALGPGFRGNKVQIPPEDLAGVKAKVRAAWRKTHGSDEEMPAILKGGEESVNKGIIQKAIDALQNILKGSDGPVLDEILKNLDEEAQGKVKTELEKRETEVKELKANLEKRDKEAKALEAKVAELEKKLGKEDKEDKILKNLDPKIKDAVEKALKGKDEVIEKLSKRLEDVEEERTKEKFAKMAGQYPNIGKTEDVAEMLRKAYEVSEEQGKKLEAMFKAANEQIENSKLFKELGSSNNDDVEGSVWEKIEKAAQELVSKNAKLTKEQAIDAVLKQDPGLYREYEKEKAVN